MTPDPLPPTPGPVVALAVGGAAVLTLSIGFWLRWHLAGAVTLPMSVAHVRHAHSHLGYFGVLFPLAWAAWATLGVRLPSSRVLWLYGIAVLVAFVGFLRGGYGPEAIAGSSVVGVVWLLSAWELRDRIGRLGDPLGLALPGVVLAMACVPPIALTLRTDPALAQAFIATFLALLLLGVIVPSALATSGVAAPGSPGLTVATVLAAASLGVWPSPWARVGLGVYGAWILWGVWNLRPPLHLRVAWSVLALGLAAVALGLVPNVRPVVIGALHFTILGPVLATLAPSWLRRSPPTGAWWVGHAAVGLLAAPLVAQGLGYGPWTATVSALGGTAVLGWWVAVLIWGLRRDPGLRTAGRPSGS